MKIKANKLSENIIAMLSLKGIEYILNFALLPFLLRVLGAERFGALAFMQGVVQYFIIITDYGFNMTAPRDIAKSVMNSNAVARIFSNVIAAKCILCITFTVLGILFMVFTGFDKKLDIPLFWATYTMVIGNIVFPVWFFQGIQQMRYITLVNIAARAFMVISVIYFVRGPEDYLVAAILQSSVTILAGFFSFIIIRKNYAFVFVKPDKKAIKEIMKDGWHIFVSTIAINIYTTTTIVVLGILTNNTIVGYYSAANKVLDSIRGVMNTITQTIYPHVARMVQDKKEKVYPFLRRLLCIYGGGCTIVGILLFVLAWLVVKILFGPGYDESINILKILAFVPPIVAVSNVFGIQCLLNFGYQRAFSKILVSASIFDLIIVGFLISFFQAEGAAFSMLLTELFVTIGTIISVKKHTNIDFIKF